MNESDQLKKGLKKLPKASSLGAHLSYGIKTNPLPSIHVSQIVKDDKKINSQLKLKTASSSTSREQTGSNHSSSKTPPEKRREKKIEDPIVKEPKIKPLVLPKLSSKAIDVQTPKNTTGRVKKNSITHSASNSLPLPKKLAPIIRVDEPSNTNRDINVLPVIFKDFTLAGIGFTDTTNALTDEIPPKTNKQTLTARGNMQPNSLKTPRRNTVTIAPKTTESQSSSKRPALSTGVSPRLNTKSQKQRIDTSKSDSADPNSTSTNAIKKSVAPWTPPTVLKQFKEKLNAFEFKEIHEFPEIYYYGINAVKIKTTSTTTSNNGFDDEQGDYKVVLGDHISYRYEIQGILGKGTFGQVVKVLDHKTNKCYAIKIIRNRSRYHQQAIIEVKILDYMKSKDPQALCNVIQTVSSFYFRSHFCITFELLSINLYDFIKANQFRGFSLSLIKKFAFQLLNSLKFLTKHHIIHCDMKPENILLNVPTKSAITVIDFGSSCFEHEKAYTYIQSRFYRAPEVILGISYTSAIDMWSLSCILAELYTGVPLFPGETELDQLSCIMELLDVPSNYLLEMSTRKKYFFAANGKPRIIENSSGIKRLPGSRDLQSLLLNCDDTKFISFLYGCLQFNPKDRMTPAQALQHPWITEDQDISSTSNSTIQEEDLMGQNQFDFYDQQTQSQSLPEDQPISNISNDSFFLENESYLAPNDFSMAKSHSFDSSYFSNSNSSNLNHENENKSDYYGSAHSEISFGSNQIFNHQREEKSETDDLISNLNIDSSMEMESNNSNNYQFNNHNSIFEDKDFAKSIMSESDNEIESEDQSDVLTQSDSPILTTRSNNPQHSPSPNFFSRSSISVG